MKLHWTSLTDRLPDEIQCLAGFIAWQAAEVISNAKPANLVNIYDRTLDCGRNIRTLWDAHRDPVLAEGEIRAVELRQKGDHLLVLIYHPLALDRVLQRKAVYRTLQSLGYRYQDAGQALAHLKLRMQSDEFPHEIGFFLGYPVKDVLSFMGLCRLPLVKNGPWKMYGRLESSLTTWIKHRAAREFVHDALESSTDPLMLLRKQQLTYGLI